MSGRLENEERNQSFCEAGLRAQEALKPAPAHSLLHTHGGKLLLKTHWTEDLSLGAAAPEDRAAHWP